MNIVRSYFSLFLALMLVVSITLLAGGYGGKKQGGYYKHSKDSGYYQQKTAEKPATEQNNIAELANATDSLSTLVAALQAADLVEVVQGPGPFTVFAPTNEAFAALGPTLDDLMKPENKEKLKQILLYHVVPGNVMSKDIKDMDVKSASGDEIEIRIVDGKVKVDDATVIKADIQASNGVVHVIDKVITP